MKAFLDNCAVILGAINNTRLGRPDSPPRRLFVGAGDRQFVRARLSGLLPRSAMRAHGQPATIGNARQKGVTELLVYCTDLVCSHSGTLPMAGLPDDLIIKPLNAVASRCL